MTTRLTDDELRAMMDGATPGEWLSDGDNDVCAYPDRESGEMGRMVAECMNEPDARLIAAAPDLAREVLELRSREPKGCTACDGTGRLRCYCDGGWHESGCAAAGGPGPCKVCGGRGATWVARED